MAERPAAILRHDPGTRMGSVEDLHQFRVGVRRLRSDLRTLEPLLERSWGLGSCRPQVTRQPAGSRPRPRRPDGSHGRGARRPGDGAAADGRRSPAAPRRHGRHSSTSFGRIGMRAPRAPRGAGSRPRAEPGRASAHGRALPTLAAPQRRLKRRRAGSTGIDRWRAAPGPVATKRARYAAETAARGLEPERAEAARRFADDLGAFQNLLGRHQDAVVAADEPPPPAAHEEGPGLVVAAGR